MAEPKAAVEDNRREISAAAEEKEPARQQFSSNVSVLSEFSQLMHYGFHRRMVRTTMRTSAPLAPCQRDADLPR